MWSFFLFLCLTERIGSISAWTFSALLHCSTYAVLSAPVLLTESSSRSAKRRETKKDSAGEEGRVRGSNIVAHDMKPQMQISPFQCMSAIACKAPHSCCWCRPFPGSDKQHTHMHSSQASLLSCPPFLSTQDMTIHAYRIISVFHAKQDGFFISAVGKTGHEQPGGLWSQSWFLNHWLSKYWKVSRLNYSP